MLTPTMDATGGMGDRKPSPTPCEVTFVNEAHLFFVVRFEGLGFCETFWMGPKTGTHSINNTGRGA